MSKTKVVHCKIDKYDVYIGRGSIWGNPYSSKKGTTAEFEVETPEEAVAKFEEYLLNSPKLMSQLHTLKGKTLGCWCKTKKNPDRICHGDVLAKLADSLTEQDDIYDNLQDILGE